METYISNPQSAGDFINDKDIGSDTAIKQILGYFPFNLEKSNITEQPIEIGSEPVENKELFVKIYNFETYEEIQKILLDMNIEIKTTTEKNKSQYNLILGPIDNEMANNLVSSFIMKGYKKTAIILK